MLGDALVRGERVYLDAVERSDMETIGPWWRSLTLQQYLNPGAMMPQGMDDELDWFDAARKNTDLYLFGIRTQADDRLIGTTTLMQFNWRCRKCLFGIAIGDQSAWNKGYGSEATALALRYGFMELNLNRIQLFVYSFNSRAVRAYEKAGFAIEGTLRENLFRDGRYWDEYVMAVLRGDWQRLSDNSQPASDSL
jgi:RimJ/RimL family protein N-acetyltransferase